MSWRASVLPLYLCVRKNQPFALNEPYYGNSASVKLLTPTQDSRGIITAATKCLDAIWRDGHRYQKAGVMLGISTARA
ncbi:hypothetical protein FMK65_27820 [Klebsiella variicola]|nr:hypothetical protein DTA24_17870 [Klebsiella sp. P1CD1]MBZ6540556.1 hypothetical protein [Klebsiella variicola]NIG48783.1 hypothetical protein [Klebsiella sp. Ap-874]NIG80057.1 hypothetical protein [Klebsiella sp. Ap-873]HBT4807880.1 hypothetical protein [Klebsiella variicola subsp. variicola]